MTVRCTKWLNLGSVLTWHSYFPASSAFTDLKKKKSLYFSWKHLYVILGLVIFWPTFINWTMKTEHKFQGIKEGKFALQVICSYASHFSWAASLFWKVFAQGSYTHTLLERYGRLNRIQFIMVNYPHIQFRYHATSSAIYNFKLINLQVFLIITVVVNLIKVIYNVNEKLALKNSMKILLKLMMAFWTKTQESTQQ